MENTIVLSQIKYERPKPVRNNLKSKVAPPMVLIGAYMGDMTKHYTFIELTIESMRWNPQIDFYLINVINDTSQAAQLTTIAKRIKAINFHHIILTVEDFSARVWQRLRIHVPMNFTSKWARKLCDYKPVFAYLFPEFIREEHQYWGYIDYDVIWGNFNAYADWFTGNYPAIFSRKHSFNFHVRFLDSSRTMYFSIQIIRL
jgi:hypothetical protein